MAEKEKFSVQPNVKMLNSVAIALLDKDGVTRHVQIVIGQFIDDGKFVCYFDVVDPSKIRLADAVQVSNND